MSYYYERSKKNPLGINLSKYKESLEASINKTKIEINKVKENLTKKDTKKKILVGLSIATAFTLGVGVGVVAKDISELQNVYLSAQEEQDKYKSIVSENTLDAGMSASGEHTYWYDTDSMALSVSSLDDDFEIEKAVYGVYSNLSYDRTEKFNDFLVELSSYVDESSYFYSLNTKNAFEKYQEDKGIDTTDVNGYKKYITEIKEQKEKTGGMSR